MTTPNSDPVCINKIDWLKIFPWLQLIQAARLGVRLRVLVPSMIMVVCLQWSTGRSLGGVMPTESLGDVWNTVGGIGMAPAIVTTVATIAVDPVGGPRRLQGEIHILTLAVILLIFFGTSIARSAATEFCSFSRTGVISGARFAAERSFSTLTALLLSVLIVGIWFLPLMLSGVLANAVGTTLVLGLWWLVAASTLAGVIALVVCGSGLLLAFGAIGTDKCGGADALSRGINYTLSHKLFTFWCLWFSSLVSFLTMAVTRAFVTAAADKLGRAVGFRDSSTADAAHSIAQATMELMALMPSAVHLGTFFSALTITYVLLRQREDGIDLREIDGGQHVLSPPAQAVKQP